MPNSNETSISNRQIHFCSLCAVANLNPGDSNDLLFYFKAGINIPTNVNMLISLKSLELPASWYNINVNNSNVPASTLDTLFTIPNGNYNPQTLAAQLNVSLTNITVTFSEVTDKYTFTNPLGVAWSWTFPENPLYTNNRPTGIARLLGFRTGTYTSDGVGVLEAPYQADLNYTTCVYVRTNFQTNQYDSRTENIRPLLAKIPLRIHRQPWAQQNMGAAGGDNQGSGFGQSGHIVYYEGFRSSDQILVPDDYQVNNIRITLEDDHLNLLPIDDTVWSATILIEYIYKEVYEVGKGVVKETAPQAVVDQK